MNKKNIALIIAVSIASGSLGLSGYLYQQIGLTNSATAKIQANTAAVQADISALNLQIEALNATVTKYEEEKTAALEFEQKENAERVYVAAMIADEIIKRNNNFDDNQLNEYLEKADRVLTGGRSELRSYQMYGEEFNRVYTKITGEVFDKAEYLKSEYMSNVPEISEERKAELQAEVAADMAAFAAEKAEEKAKIKQLEKEKAMLEEVKTQQESGAAPKYARRFTDEELEAMGSTDDYDAYDLTGKDFSGGTPIIGFN